MLCAVYGPMEVKLRNELVDRAFIDVVVKPAIGVAGEWRAASAPIGAALT